MIQVLRTFKHAKYVVGAMAGVFFFTCSAS
jgi:hypothetical protein